MRRTLRPLRQLGFALHRALPFGFAMSLACQGASSTPSAGTTSPQVSDASREVKPDEPRAKSGIMGFELRSEDLDRSIAVSDDFYGFANGGWLSRTEIPGSRSYWSAGAELKERIREQIEAILNEAMAVPEPTGSEPIELWMLGDFYASGLDSEAISSRALTALEPLLQAIDELASHREIPAVVALLHQHGVPVLFTPSADNAMQNHERVVFWAMQGGLTLPAAEYYIQADPRSKALRTTLQSYIRSVLELGGKSSQQAEIESKWIVAMETALAKDFVPARELVDAAHYDGAFLVSKYRTRDRVWDWRRYLDAIGLVDEREINRPMPTFFARIDALLAHQSLDQWKAYLRFHLLDSVSELLVGPWEAVHFEFYGRALGGLSEIKPHQERVMLLTNAALGDWIGREFVKRHYTSETHVRAMEMVDALRRAMQDALKSNAWMTEVTRQKALEKLHAMRFKVGYPEVWSNYEGAVFQRDAWLANHLSIRQATFRETMARVGKAPDPRLWSITPQTVNAYFDPLRNEIVVPAAFFQAPFFDVRADAALNLGGLGSVVGHEITHAFDPAGSKFDANGQFRNWWTPEDWDEFRRRAAVLERQYAQYEALPGVFVDGKLTLGENVADLGGLRLALRALQTLGAGKPDPQIDGWTQEQRFFLSYARLWRELNRREYLETRLRSDPHSPGRFRVNGVVSNMKEFATAFGVPAGRPMARTAEQRADVW